MKFKGKAARDEDKHNKVEDEDEDEDETAHNGPASDEDVRTAARKHFGESFTRHYDDGSLHGYRTSADAAAALLDTLATFSRDAAQIDRLFRHSKLFSLRSVARQAQWDTDGADMIRRALERTADDYNLRETMEATDADDPAARTDKLRAIGRAMLGPDASHLTDLIQVGSGRDSFLAFYFAGQSSPVIISARAWWDYRSVRMQLSTEHVGFLRADPNNWPQLADLGMQLARREAGSSVKETVSTLLVGFCGSNLWALRDEKKEGDEGNTPIGKRLDRLYPPTADVGTVYNGLVRYNGRFAFAWETFYTYVQRTIWAKRYEDYELRGALREICGGPSEGIPVIDRSGKRTSTRVFFLPEGIEEQDAHTE